MKILSKHLLPQGEGVFARASVIAVKVQCRPDFPRENLSMVVGPAHNLAPHWLFRVGLSHISHAWNSSPQIKILQKKKIISLMNINAKILKKILAN